MDNSVLDVTTCGENEYAITKKESPIFSPNNPLALSTLDSIVFTIGKTDSLIYLKDGVLILHGSYRKSDGTACTHTTLANAGALHLFSRASIRMNNTTLESVDNIGLVGIVKMYSSFSEGQARHLGMMGWMSGNLITSGGDFTARIPLSAIFGVARDFDKVLINPNLEISLERSRSNIDAMFSTSADEAAELTLTKAQLKFPYLTVNDDARVKFLDLLKIDKPLSIPFYKWDFYQWPDLAKVKTHTWNVRTTSLKERPRFIIFFLQTKRAGVRTKSSSEFDHCGLVSLRAQIGREWYPSETEDQDFDKNDHALFYDNYCKFGIFVNKNPHFHPILTMATFKTEAPLIIIDCDKKDNSIKETSLNVRLDFELKAAAPADTTANCILINEADFIYLPFSSVVRKNES